MTAPYHTTHAKALEAVAQAQAKRAALKAADEKAAERRGEVKQVRKLDGLALLHKSGRIDDDQFRAGLAYQKAFEACAGLRGRNSLNDTPPGDKETALQATIDAGRLVKRCEALCDRDEIRLLRIVVGQGHSVSSIARGRHYAEVVDVLAGVLAKMVEARI